MQASRINKLGEELKVEQVELPVLKKGSVIVKVLSANITSFAHEVVSGSRHYPFPPLPFTPGASCVGRVEEVASNVTGVKKGQLVLVNAELESPKPSNAPKLDSILLGWIGLGPESSKTYEEWRNGCWAEQVVVPASSLVLVPEAVEKKTTPSQLAALIYYFISYGGLVRGDFKAGQVVVVNGVSGLALGTTLIALALGASRVIVVGRSDTSLQQVQKLSPNRVSTVNLTGLSVGDLSSKIRAAAADIGGVDLVVDCLGSSASGDITTASVKSLKPKGIAVIVGSPSGKVDLNWTDFLFNQFDIRGSMMFPADAPETLFKSIIGGTLDLSCLEIAEFPLSKINEAIQTAKLNSGFKAVSVVNK